MPDLTDEDRQRLRELSEINDLWPCAAIRALLDSEAAAGRERDAARKCNRAAEDQLVWLADWCRKFTGVENDAVIGRDGWPHRLVEVVAKAVEAERDAALERAEESVGAAKSQDERERQAGALCGISWEEHGCDWPAAVAESLVCWRKRAEEADRDYKELASAIGLDILRKQLAQEAKSSGNW